MNLDLSAPEYAALVAAAQRAGQTPEQYAEQAISAAIHARYVLPKNDAKVLPFQAPKRVNP